MDYLTISELEKLLDRQLEWVRAAESRIQLIVPLGSALFASVAIKYSELEKATNGVQVAAWFCLVFLAASIAFCTFAMFPRTSGPARSLIFFGPIATFSADEYQQQLKSLSEEDYFADLASQIHVNARIANQKYTWIGRSMAFLMIAFAPWAFAVMNIY
ncbi:Pycsar system effector family protein [Pseudosulfitobacter sp. DSM 107133]|uniref:Pycsar system effector family protein n=1 Tax=Pseudosulfitobacter sp. DSM 107133 TaxID=2883100 RepID=UPI000DF22FF1|nr:Pycsar system effector family protein [Pseudosulfitobacter sp. DSM 107133]